MLAGLKRSFWYGGYIACAPRSCKLLYLLHTYIPDLHFCKAILNNCTTEGITSRSEKYTVRGSRARERARISGDVMPIYIVANGNDNVMRT